MNHKNKKYRFFSHSTAGDISNGNVTKGRNSRRSEEPKNAAIALALPAPSNSQVRTDGTTPPNATAESGGRCLPRRRELRDPAGETLSERPAGSNIIFSADVRQGRFSPFVHHIDVDWDNKYGCRYSSSSCRLAASVFRI